MKNTMVKKQFTSSGILEKNLEAMEKELVENKDKDMVVLVIGQPGTSKSSLSLMMQLALRGEINFDDMAFNHDQYMEATKNGEKNKVIQYDEGRDSFYKRRAMSSSNTEAIDMLNQFRFKKHVHFINFQNLTDLELDLLYKRAHALIRTPSQGFYHFYNQKTMRKIEVDKRNRKVDWPDPNFTGRFPDPAEEFPEAWKRYQQVNEEKLQEAAQEEEEGTDWEDKYRTLRMKVAKTFVKHLDMTQAEAAETVGVDRSMYTKWKKDYNLTNLPPFDISDHVE